MSETSTENEAEVVTDDTASSEDAKAQYLRFAPCEKEYDAENLVEMFSDIAGELGASGVNSIKKSPELLKSVCAAIGTHSMKFITTRAAQSKEGQSVFSVGDERLMFSGNAADSKIAKILLRPTQIVGENRPYSFIERVRNNNIHAESMLEAFGEIFGEEAADAIKSAKVVTLKDIDTLPTSNFPIFYAPHPDGDVQVTPLPPMESFNLIKRETNRFLRKAQKDEHVRRGSFIHTAVTGKMQLLSPEVMGDRRRLLSKVGSVANSDFATLYRFVMTSYLPRMYDGDLDQALLKFAELNKADMAGASSIHVSEAIDNLLGYIEARAFAFATETCEAARVIAADFKAPTSLDIRNIIFSGLDTSTRRGSKAETQKAKLDLAAVRAGINGRGSSILHSFAKAYADFAEEFNAETGA